MGKAHRRSNVIGTTQKYIPTACFEELSPSAYTIRNLSTAMRKSISGIGDNDNSRLEMQRKLGMVILHGCT